MGWHAPKVWYVTCMSIYGNVYIYYIHIYHTSNFFGAIFPRELKNMETRFFSCFYSFIHCFIILSLLLLLLYHHHHYNYYHYHYNYYYYGLVNLPSCFIFVYKLVEYQKSITFKQKYQIFSNPVRVVYQNKNSNSITWNLFVMSDVLLGLNYPANIFLGLNYPIKSAMPGNCILECHYASNYFLPRCDTFSDATFTDYWRMRHSDSRHIDWSISVTS